MKKLIALSFCGCLAVASTSSAIDLKQSKLTQVVNDVQIISAADQSKKNATVNDLFNMPDILRTGTASRAELVAADETVTRVGANTIFSFDPANRTIDLQQGSLLFHSPHGKGGGTIHTGSATASVLGTTLIVTTTPNGGMKVLDLEGSVAVNFTNHLKQKLSPGQMTFVLPGGVELAPIIIFRMDDLIQNSLLVHGFTQPLPSLPLIQNQVNKQDNLIKTGRATDTGLVVGNSATPNSVEVLDPNTIQSGINSPALINAFEADATINQPSLTDASVPTPPNHIFVNQIFALPNNPYFGNRQFTGFAAHNIFINSLVQDSLPVNLSAYGNLPEFDLVAANNLAIGGSVTFDGFSPQHSIFFSLIAGNQILIAPGATVTANIGNFELSAAGALTLNGSAVEDSIGNIRITSGSDILVENDATLSAFGNVGLSCAGDLTLSHSTVNANSATITPVGGSLLLDSSTLNLAQFCGLTAKGDITVNNSTLNANPAAGLISINSTAGSVNLSGTTIQTYNLTVNSGDGILLNGNGGALTTFGGAASANFTALKTVTLNNADFTAFSQLNVAAQTVTVNNVNLPLITNVGTATGSVNVNGPATFGWFNILNSRWVNTPITSAAQVTLASGPGSAPGIYSYALGGK
jgi:ferric-dicitrate binding protein FerR (iron transport regulator)